MLVAFENRSIRNAVQVRDLLLAFENRSIPKSGAGAGFDVTEGKNVTNKVHDH